MRPAWRAKAENAFAILQGTVTNAFTALSDHFQLLYTKGLKRMHLLKSQKITLLFLTI
jgi:hypothetical protein